MSTANNGLPGWGQMPHKPGMYLSLNHGCDFPRQVLKTEGFAGPKIGPLTYLKTRFAQQVTLGFENHRDAGLYFPETKSQEVQTLEIVAGTLIFGGKCYGDWDVCYISAEFCRSRGSKIKVP